MEHLLASSDNINIETSNSNINIETSNSTQEYHVIFLFNLLRERETCLLVQLLK